MTKSQLFTKAHAIAKTLEGDYRARFSYGLSVAWKEVKNMNKNLDVKELRAIQEMINKDEAKLWINKRIKKLEAKKDSYSLEIAKKLTKNSTLLDEIVSKIEAEKIAEVSKDLKIIVKESKGNIIVNGQHKVLNKRLDKEIWEKVAHCFKFVNTREVNDEIWGEQFVGFEIVNEAELRKILKF